MLASGFESLYHSYDRLQRQRFGMTLAADRLARGLSTTVLNVIQIIVAVVLVAVVLMQVRGQGSGLFGSAESSFRTRRGLEKTLFQFTIALVGVFIVTSLISARV